MSTIGWLWNLQLQKEVISAQNSQAGKKSVALKVWVNKVVKSKVAARNGCNDVNAN